ncbi:MAG: exo-beta-N-acetylmuramidase NamZ domain-containing protein [Zhaonellaceae bacterium]|jgi:uncharacterized protein YbbC (DUF1343 family)
MKKILGFILSVLLVFLNSTPLSHAETPTFKLGNEVLMTKFQSLLKGKRIGLITNQSGVDSQGRSIINLLAENKDSKLVALYGPEHGIDGKAKAGEYVKSYTHPTLKIPVYSLYGETRMPTADMLKNVDMLVFDIQDIGARTYTYMSTLNYCMVAAEKYNKQIVVLDRPNPLGGEIVEGPVLEDPFITFVGVDNLPMAHGMTAGELALFFNRKIGANLKVIPMEGYTRNMIYEDTGLKWVPTSPNIPDLTSVRGYMATGLGEGTGIYQADKFKWIGGKGIDAEKFAKLMNDASLPGVEFIPEMQGQAGGVRLKITNPRTFNPAKSGIYALAYARALSQFTVPKSGKTVVMFDKIMGTDKMGKWLEQNLTPQQIEAQYASDLAKFKKERAKYLIYDHIPREVNPSSGIPIYLGGKLIPMDEPPYINADNRVLVPLRAIGEALGAQVDWEPYSKLVTVTKEGLSIQMTIGSRKVSLNGQQNTMDTNPVIKNGRTMIPLRYIGEYFGRIVEWNSASRTVTIY